MGKRHTKNVLLVENDRGEARTIVTIFNEQDLYSFELTHAQSMEQAEAYLGLQSVSVVLLDINGFPGDSCLEAMRRTRAVAPRASLVLLTDLEGEPIALPAMEAGAQDYLIKGHIEPHELLRAMRSSVARKILEDKLFNEKNRA